MSKKPRLGPKGTLLCDVCDRPCQTLGGHTASGNWSVCHRCFDKADHLSYLEKRMPNDSDFAKLRKDKLRAW